MSTARNRMTGAQLGRGVGEKPQNFAKTLLRLFRYIGRYRALLLFALLLAALGSAFSVIGPAVMGEAITEVFEGFLSALGGGAGIDLSVITGFLTFLLTLYIISNLLHLVQGYIMVWITQKVTHTLRMDLSQKMHRLPMSSFESGRHGDILSIFTNDMETLSQAMQQAVSGLITSFATIIGVLVMMFSIDWGMTLIVLLILPLTSLVLVVVVRNSQKHFTAQQKHLGALTGQVEEQFSGLQVVQSFNGEASAEAMFSESNQALYKDGWKSQFFSSVMFPITHVVSNIAYVAVAIAAAFFAAGGRISIGAIQAFLTYTRNFSQPVTQIAQITTMLQSMTAAAERVFAFLDREEEASPPSSVQLERATGEVAFQHVRFGYDPERPVLHDFTVQVAAGARVAIVGPTGAGKTTVIKLLMRFYDLQAGTIRIDGQDIRALDRQSLRGLFGMVLQDTWLFSGSILENIRYGKLDATDDEVIAAAKAANAHHFISALPEGYHMRLDEQASNLSQGQRQLLTIARAFLADRPLLILDEATSSVDTRTEALIQGAMQDLMAHRTCFVIAHRLSTIQNADLILVMERGDIAEQGTHKELLARDGIYAKLWGSQFSA